MGENPILFVTFYFSFSVVGTEVFLVYFLNFCCLKIYTKKSLNKIKKVSVSHDMGELSFYNGVIFTNERIGVFACVFVLHSHAVG